MGCRVVDWRVAFGARVTPLRGLRIRCGGMGEGGLLVFVLSAWLGALYAVGFTGRFCESPECKVRVVLPLVSALLDAVPRVKPAGTNGRCDRHAGVDALLLLLTLFGLATLLGGLLARCALLELT